MANRKLQMDDILSRKLAALADETSLLVNLRAGVDLTTHPSHPRISFPAPDYTPPFQILDRAGLAQLAGIEPDWIPGIVSKLENVSSSPAGVCLVTSSVLMLSNAHAGSHADQPGHWLAEPPFPEFDHRQYTGPVTILNLAPALAQAPTPAITVAMLEACALETGLNWQTVRRVILRNYGQTPQTWDAEFAFLSPEAGTFLGALPQLVLFGTDAPSVDHAEASPIIACAHGGLWAGRVAILEGLETNHLPKIPRLDGVLQVQWNPMQCFPDAKGALVTFFTTN